MKKYKNRYGDEYWFESIEPNQYRFVMTGTSMKYCRYGGRELQEGIDIMTLACSTLLVVHTLKLVLYCRLVL
jgi:hypothetical protein